MLFPNFGNSFVNLNNGDITSQYLAVCRWNPITAPFCPIFYMSDMAEAAGITPMALQTMLTSGGIIAVQLTWNCDLDKSGTECVPTIAFNRLDNPDSDVR